MLWDCCCLCNPFYTFSEEADEITLVEQPRDALLTPRHRLPPDWDPLLQYYAVFDRLDTQFDAALEPLREPVRPSAVGTTQRAERALEKLESERGGTHNFNMLRLAIRELPAFCAERERLIRRCEHYRALYSSDDQAELQQAIWWLALARDATQPDEQRILYFQKSLFYTHRPSEKAALRQEYEKFCGSLRF